MLRPVSRARQVCTAARPHTLVLAAAGLLVLAGTAWVGCYWLRYGDLARTHVSLLLSMADKMSDLLESGRRVAPEAMAEFTYPLARARDFARIAAKRYRGRRSLRAFSRLLGSYEALVQEMDRLRLSPVTPADLSRFRRLAGDLRLKAAAVTRALEDEQHGRRLRRVSSPRLSAGPPGNVPAPHRSADA